MTPTKLFSSVTILLCLTAGCSLLSPAPTSAPNNEPAGSSESAATQQPASTAAADAPTAAPTAAPVQEAAPAVKTFDLTDLGVAIKVELPPDAKLDKAVGKLPAVNVQAVESGKWKTGLTLMKADAKHSTVAQWKTMIGSPKLRGKVLREDGDLLVTLIPENQHGFVYFIRAGKDTFLCQNYGATDNEAALEQAIAACKTAKP